MLANGLQRLAGVILLSGTLRKSAFGASLGRSVLDLPIDAGLSVLTEWLAECGRLACELNRPQLPVWVLLDRASAEPKSLGVADPHVTVSVWRDRSEYRGTGGVLRDHAQEFSPDDFLLVGNAAQILAWPLVRSAKALAENGRDAAIVSHEDGSPSGLMLVRCGCLKDLPESGFVDMKEQGLPAIARKHRVGVVECDEATAWPVRTLSDYLDAIRARRASRAEHMLPHHSLDEVGPVFSLVERPADVADGARLCDAVVLAGGRVETGAVVIRSVVGPGGVVRRGDTVSDSIVTGSGSSGVRKP